MSIEREIKMAARTFWRDIILATLAGLLVGLLVAWLNWKAGVLK